MARFVISGRKVTPPLRPWIYYVGRGYLSSSPEGAAVFSSLAEAKRETDIWRGEERGYSFKIEKLARGSMRTAFLHSEEIEY